MDTLSAYQSWARGLERRPYSKKTFNVAPWRADLSRCASDTVAAAAFIALKRPTLQTLKEEDLLRDALLNLDAFFLVQIF